MAKRKFIKAAVAQGAMHLLIMGPQGAGKGTQAAKLAVYFKIPHISSGDLFREHIKQKTELGVKIQQRVNEGALVDDATTVAMIRERLARPDCANGVILEGFPRTLPQAQDLDAFATPEAVIMLDIDDDEAIERISGRRICPACGRNYHINYLPPRRGDLCDDDGAALIHRADDNPAAIAARLIQYHEQTAPLRDYYRAQGKLRVVNGSQPIDKVFKEILFKLRLELV